MSRREVARTAAAPGLSGPFWAVMAALVLGVELVAALTGGDASWDFRNYHLYNPFALLEKPFGVDIAPAHMQTWFPPTMDLIYYGFFRSISWTPLLNAVIALPQAVAVGLAFVLTCRVLQPRTGLEVATLGVFSAIGATGAAGGMTIATASSEMLPAALIMFALLLLVPSEPVRSQADPRPTPSQTRLFWAGTLFGCACGLKLTMSYATIAMALALIVMPRRRLFEILTRPALFGVGVVLGTGALSAYWWVYEWQHFGNPLFPAFNDIFRSPHAAFERYVDQAFMPHSLGEVLSVPWVWTLRLSRAASESRLRDPRFALALIAALVWLSASGLRRPRWRPWPATLLTVWFVLGFVLWRLEFSVYRYLSVLELLAGTMLALVALPLARRLAQPKLLAAGAVGLLAACLVLTVNPQVNRSRSGTPPLAVDLGPLSPDSMVLLLDNEPMSYLAVFADPRIRFIGTNDFFMTLDSSNPMQRDVEKAIDGHRGPLWGLDSPAEQGDRSEQTLRRYDLVRGPCRAVVSNVSPLPIRLCQLQRA